MATSDTTHKPTSVEQYIDSFAPETQAVLRRLRSTIAAALASSDETIRYGMPAAMSEGRWVVHYAAWKHHIGMYPIPRLPDALEAEVAPLRAAKDTIRLRLDRPIPYELVSRLTSELVRMRAADEA